MPRQSRLLSPLLSLSCLLLAHGAVRAADDLADTVCTTPGKPVDEQGYVTIGGIEQWVRIKGASCANPVLLLVHGGPGNPLTPYADNIYKAWEQDFTIVQWDQRGAGKTWERKPIDEDTPLTIDLLRDDGIAVTRYAAGRFGKRQVILMGGSWSSALGVHMAKGSPASYCAFVTTGQLVQGFAQRDSYDATLSQARAAGDKDAVEKLEKLGPPPWTDPRNPGILRRVTRKYEAMSTEPAPKSWWTPSPVYATPSYEKAYEAGEDYSWLQFVGMHGDGMASKLDLYKLGPDFAMPVYMVQGAQDLVTMPAQAKRYFDTIKAPRKEFVLVERTGHDPNVPMLAAQYRLLKERVGECK
ncbi:alpha/beta fold hydrolase [uncultured Massilia sp.]|uniref:alpha/beta hydrolase n=1 Tax=uncultured Massilia sp. TaxID=169973 RepID=UPI0025D73DFC|nr:alpha/beta hydrolase [uncultured Massilia sp.]